MRKKFILDGEEIDILLTQQSRQRVSFEIEGEKFDFTLLANNRDEYFMAEKGQNTRVYYDGESLVASGYECTMAPAQRGRGARQKSDGVGPMVTPMPGKVLRVLVARGEQVTKGQKLIIVEAMKMEHGILANRDGRVGDIFYSEGDLVDGGVVLLEIEEGE